MAIRRGTGGTVRIELDPDAPPAEPYEFVIVENFTDWTRAEVTGGEEDLDQDNAG